MNGLIKICGVTTSGAIDIAAASGATHIGFNFVPTSPRFIAPSDAADLSRKTPDRIVRVAVTADASDDTLEAVLRIVRPTMFQLHGQEDTQRVAHIRARFCIPVVKALGVSTVEDLRAARGYLTCADFLLFDAKPPKTNVATPTGGHGKTFDWAILTGQTFRKPWFLSGGLTPANVAAAIETTRAPGVDVASGVESARGVKDNSLIADFCAAASRAFTTEAVA
jgi:phosphoribosylanthranilate isomerase